MTSIVDIMPVNNLIAESCLTREQWLSKTANKYKTLGDTESFKFYTSLLAEERSYIGGRCT